MATEDPLESEELDDREGLELPPDGPAGIPLPAFRFPSSLRPPKTQGPAQDPPAGATPQPPPAEGDPGMDPTGLSGPPTGSSTGSTSRTYRGLPPQEDWADPKDLQSAIGQVVDVSFVLVGQGLGSMERKAKGLPGVDPKWVPTKTERKLIMEPASRIAKRHIRASSQTMDTIDGCLIAAGVGHFAVTRLFDVDPLGDGDAA